MDVWILKGSAFRNFNAAVERVWFLKFGIWFNEVWFECVKEFGMVIYFICLVYHIRARKVFRTYHLIKETYELSVSYNY